MLGGTQRQGTADLDLLRGVFAQQPGAWARFLERCQADIYTACRLTFPDQQADDAYVDVVARLRADDFAVLRAFDGRATLSAYLRLVLRDLLSQEVTRRLTRDPAHGWQAFEHFFKRDIMRIIMRCFPTAADSGRDEDIYHDVVAALVEDDYHRIRAYDGHGSFGGFVLRIVNNHCIDLLRKEMPRRRLPAAIQRLPAAEQEIFRQLYWENCPEQQLGAALKRASIVIEGPDAIAAAVKAVRAALPRNFAAGADEERPRPVSISTLPDGQDPLSELPDDRATPEEDAITRETERALEQASAALKSAIGTLSSEVRLYLQYVMTEDPPLAPREIARLMARPVAEIYRLRQQAERQLRQVLAENAAVKNLRMSV
jgi:RNA polymerase primary sigma factor